MTLRKFLPAALVRNKPRLLGAVCACVFPLGFSTTANSVVIDAYFGMNYVGGPVFEVQLLNITYVGGGGDTFTTAMPALPGLTPGSFPGSGLPDGIGLTVKPTYTTTPLGDGETTRTYAATVPIDWDITTLAFPSIAIKSISLSAFGQPIEGTITFATHYIVGLIPAGTDTELLSSLGTPQGDIYDDLAGVTGNPTGTTTGDFEGEFIFAAAAVPVPAAVWLFGSGLIGLVGIARRKPR